MKRWFYILLGGLGMSLSAGAVVALIWLQHPGQAIAFRLLILEWALIPAGFAMAVVGFINGRNAGELDIAKYMKAPRRNHGINDGEIHFMCPACRKIYRASPLLVGKKFTCRDCGQVFDVTVSESKLPRAIERRMLPAS